MNTIDQQQLITSVKYWIKKTIIGFNFCPFAKREFDADRIHFEVVQERNSEEQLHALYHEFNRLQQNPQIETSIVIFPVGLEGFFDYLDFLEIANEFLVQQGFEGIFQLASFHPDYFFEDAKQDAPENYTNRSPLPLIHILREASLEKALANYPSPEDIPQRNIELAKKTGSGPFEAILEECKKAPKQH